MYLQCLYLILFVCFSTYEAAFVDTMTSCPIKDQTCLKDGMQRILQAIGKDGIPDYNIQPIDPLELKHFDISVLNMINISMWDITIKGLKDTVLTRFDVQLEKRRTIIDLYSDIYVKGKYKTEEANPILSSLLGTDLIRGAGNFELTLKKIQLKMTYYHHFEKKADGEIYLKLHPDEFRYTYSIAGGGMKVANLQMGQADASALIVEFINQNWAFLMQNFGTSFLDVAMKIANDMLDIFCDMTPVKYYFKHDFTPYITNN